MPAPTTLTLLGGVLATPAAVSSPSPLLADNIDPTTRDYRSLLVGADPTDAAVQLALQVVRASGVAVLDVGMDPIPSKMEDGLALVVQSQVRAALARLVGQGDVQLKLNKLDADESIQAGVLRVQYVNLRNGSPAPATAAVPQRSFAGVIG